jgi:4-hydroxybenzoate polyprenyltransferase
MKETVLNYLRLGRAQTYPADWLLVLLPFLTGVQMPLLRVAAMSVFMFLLHIVSFGENSVLDFTQGYDKVDPSKSSHPLCTGAISVPNAMKFVHWGKALLATVACIMAFLWSPNPVMAMFFLFMWYAWGTAYNVGLSKVSLLGFLPISICFAAMGGFGWFLSHEDLTPIANLYLIYVFTVILFQISWSGHLKEMGQSERSNILIRMGASLRDGRFDPGRAFLYGFGVKMISLFILGMLMELNKTPLREVWLYLVIFGVFVMTILLLLPREYDRARELKWMSLMEILSIYAPIPLMLPWVWAFPLMLMGVAYFYLMNRALWGVAYPKV